MNDINGTKDDFRIAFEITCGELVKDAINLLSFTLEVEL
jgi:hypothetical protein